jgi:hypothetical protein
MPSSPLPPPLLSVSAGGAKRSAAFGTVRTSSSLATVMSAGRRHAGRSSRSGVFDVEDRLVGDDAVDLFRRVAQLRDLGSNSLSW